MFAMLGLSLREPLAVPCSACKVPLARLCTGPSIMNALVVWVSCASPSVSQTDKAAHPPAGSSSETAAPRSIWRNTILSITLISPATTKPRLRLPYWCLI